MKKIFIILILSIIFSVSACTDKKIEPNYAEIYSLTLDSYMPIDSALNYEMKYIAIDTKTLKNATKEDVKYILEYFDKYGVDVIDESSESLAEKGLIRKEKGNSLEGILLSIDKVEAKSDKEIILEGSKFKSGLGAIGVRTIIIYDDKWKIKESSMTYIS